MGFPMLKLAAAADTDTTERLEALEPDTDATVRLKRPTDTVRVNKRGAK
jgi:hypothetical protein